MKHLILAVVILMVVPAFAAEPSPYEPCSDGFLAHGRAPESIYLCAGPKLTCRLDWFVGGADTASDRIRSYECKPDVMRLNAMAGATPALCTERFLPRPGAVRDGQTYRCEAVDPRIETHCRPGYAPGGLMLGGKPLAHANGEAAATQRQLDSAQLTYVCVKQ
ncbi:MAG: hypothetical protein KGJ49_02210 [Alphaproteobacteria bacterium]|nr:hypothetical protein [Alphaproteobacteria bacterium]